MALLRGSSRLSNPSPPLNEVRLQEPVDWNDSVGRLFVFRRDHATASIARFGLLSFRHEQVPGQAAEVPG